MTEEQEKPRCDIGDILCQMQVLSHLKGMKSAFGDEEFQKKFPEFENWDTKIMDTIARQEIDLKEALGKCGLTEPEIPKIEEGEE